VEAVGADAYNYPGAAEEKSLIEQMKVRWGDTLEDSDDDESDDDADMEGDEGAENEVHPLYHRDAQLPLQCRPFFFGSCQGGDDGIQTPMTDGGTQSVSSLTSGMETPESIDLRKKQAGTETPVCCLSFSDPSVVSTLLFGFFFNYGRIPLFVSF
jgi:hypothetical protein